MANESYAKAKTLATICYHGECFRIVRRRIQGKPWRGYIALVQGDTYVAGCDETADAQKAHEIFSRRFAKYFPTRESLLAALQPILERYKPE